AGLRQGLVAHATHYLLSEVAKQRGLDASLYHDNWREDPDTPFSRLISTGGVFVCDFDRDGILDVLITDVNPYTLYPGCPDGRFPDVPGRGGLPRLPTNHTPLSGVACWIDIDGDGWDDLILGEWVFRNVEGKHFVIANARLPLPPDTMGLVVADY